MKDLFAELPLASSSVVLTDLAKSPMHALELGKAAEHIVCADLILSGYRAYLSDQGLPYDIVVDLSGKLIRIQVKATCFARNVNMQGRAPRMAYSFSVRRRGKNGAKRLCFSDCDIVALVALDRRVVAYLPISGVGTTCQLVAPGSAFLGKYKRSRIKAIDALSFKKALGLS